MEGPSAAAAEAAAVGRTRQSRFTRYVLDVRCNCRFIGVTALQPLLCQRSSSSKAISRAVLGSQLEAKHQLCCYIICD